MPELPEVEVVRAGLQRHVTGARIAAVEVLHPRPLRRDPRGSDGFVAALVGRRIEAVRRRGKYFWLALDADAPDLAGDALLGHLGMSGQMLLHHPGAPDERHLRVRFTLATDEGPDHMKTFTAQVRVGDKLYGNGVGRSKKEAEQASAETAYGEIATRLGVDDSVDIAAQIVSRKN